MPGTKDTVTICGQRIHSPKERDPMMLFFLNGHVVTLPSKCLCLCLQIYAAPKLGHTQKL